jgi:DNA-binding transcriptional MerR regulator
MVHADLLQFTAIENNDDKRKIKAPGALRTISEASEILDVPQHVLRFWETKFAQIKPLKRNGGRRFYRPEDIEVLQQIKFLLYKQGYTIKGAKKAIEEFAKIVDSTSNPQASADWFATIPPANVNDNSLPVAEIEAEPILPIVNAAIDDNSIDDLRAELTALRSMLTQHLPG